MPLDEKFYQLSERVALLGQVVEGQQAAMKEQNVIIQNLQQAVTIMQTQRGMIAGVGGTVGAIIGGLIVYGIKSKLGF